MTVRSAPAASPARLWITRPAVERLLAAGGTVFPMNPKAAERFRGRKAPSGGQKLAPRLLGESGAKREVFESAEALQGYAGTAPVTKQSAKSCFVHVRRACNKVLRATVHLWADERRRTCAWADACYQQKKAQGQSHAPALRCLGQRWLKILWRMWQDRMCYNEALHRVSLAKSGSWVIGLLPSPRPAPIA